MGTHNLTSDAEPNDGGSGLGPLPHDFLSVALATCTSMTLQMYAKRKEWPLEKILVDVHFKKSPDGGTVFYKKIEMEGALSDEQKAKLIEISDKCPVFKTLTGGITVEMA